MAFRLQSGPFCIPPAGPASVGSLLPELLPSDSPGCGAFPPSTSSWGLRPGTSSLAKEPAELICPGFLGHRLAF